MRGAEVKARCWRSSCGCEADAPARHARILPALFCAAALSIAAMIGSGPSRASSAESAAAPLRMQWAIAPRASAAGADQAGSRALVTLTNAGTAPLPAQGWALYFNCLAGVHTGPLASHLELEQLVGTWYRLRPVAGFGGLDAGRSVEFEVVHPETLVNTTKAPIGPYVVFDAAPRIGRRLAGFQVVLPDDAPRASPEDLYRRNATIADVPADELPPVLPTPRRLERRAGVLHWAAAPAVLAPRALQAEAAAAAALLRPYFPQSTPPAGVPPLTLRVGAVAGETSPEAYELRIEPAVGVALTANGAAGIARGLETLRALLPPDPRSSAAGIALPALLVRDAPRFDYRGLLLDVARNFQPKSRVLRLLDLMARYKLNVLHLHLTDDEGWRLEIAGLPELTRVGARRGHTLDSAEFLPPAYGSGPDLHDAAGSGHYSRADYLEILRYAAARHIEVVPELEMPGHARAAVKAMESRARVLERMGRAAAAARYLLSDSGDASVYLSAQHYTDNVMNPALPSTYTFVEHVVRELVALHREAGVPLRTLHVGGDELPDGTWERSPAALALMRREQLASRDELWNHFYTRVAAILRRHGLRAAGWEELGARRATSGELEPNPALLRHDFLLYAWNDTGSAPDLPNRLANAGYEIVLAPATRLYFDMAHTADADEPGTNWAANTDLEAVYDFAPLDAIRKSATDPAPAPGSVVLNEVGRRRVRGIEATLFTETVRESERLDYMLMPRLLALAERAWAPDPEWLPETDPARRRMLHARAWSRFANQLGKQVLPRLSAEFPDLHYRIPPPGLQRVGDRVLANHQFPGFTLRYSADGTEPTTDSPPVTGPISARGILAVAAFDRNGRRSRSLRIANP